ncbi:hypothetical protein LCGC14_2198800 [marine sediment metagenome]|uniref:Uncharacterized protein n=1 Tax=marine sediment metagenome TaxID=412755 RepID=A0A0F9DHB6_9ZZZZ
MDEQKLGQLILAALAVSSQVKVLEREAGEINLKISKSKEDDAKQHAIALADQKKHNADLDSVSKELAEKKEELSVKQAELKKNGADIKLSGSSSKSINI